MSYCDCCRQLCAPGTILGHVISGVRYRYCVSCHYNWFTEMVTQSAAVGVCDLCGAWTDQATLSPWANGTGGWDLTCLACRSAADLTAPSPELSERTVAPATHPYERGGHTYQIHTTGWEKRSPNNDLFYQRVELPPGEQVPCTATRKSERSAPEAPFCLGWAERGWRHPEKGYFYCDGCWEEAHKL